MFTFFHCRDALLKLSCSVPRAFPQFGDTATALHRHLKQTKHSHLLCHKTFMRIKYFTFTTPGCLAGEKFVVIYGKQSQFNVMTGFCIKHLAVLLPFLRTMQSFVQKRISSRLLPMKPYQYSHRENVAKQQVQFLDQISHHLSRGQFAKITYGLVD